MATEIGFNPTRTTAPCYSMEWMEDDIWEQTVKSGDTYNVDKVVSSCHVAAIRQ